MPGQTLFDSVDAKSENGWVLTTIRFLAGRLGNPETSAVQVADETGVENGGPLADWAEDHANKNHV